MTRSSLVFVCLALLTSAWPAQSADTQPYFVSMKNAKTFMREGPGENFPVKWIYHRKGLPVEVIASFESWRRVRDMDGEIGWMHVVVLSRDRMAAVREGIVQVHARAEGDSKLVATAAAGAVGRLKHCAAAACEVEFGSAGGWVARTQLWGVHDGEQF
jgi:SH3-like domain-containing protein